MDRPDFYFDAMSPYAWLAAEWIEKMLGPVEWRPVLLGGTFVAPGRSSWGRRTGAPEGMTEVESRARRYGLGPVDWPAMRLGFRAGRVLGERTAAEEAPRARGVEPEAALELATSRAGKDDWRSRTDDAVSGGIFGVPTVIVDGASTTSTISPTVKGVGEEVLLFGRNDRGRCARSKVRRWITGDGGAAR